MLALMDQTPEPIVADEAEALIAKTAVERLKSVAESNVDIKITVDGKQDERIIVPLPARAVALIYDVLKAMADRTPMTLIPYDTELTTQQAADYLNVSRPYLIRKIDVGELDYRKVGSHRRVRFADLIAYEQKCRVRQREAMAELAREADRLGLE